MQGEKQQGGTTANAGAKFALGLLAGIAAVLLPRLLAPPAPVRAQPRGATEKLDLAIAIIEKGSAPGDEAYACLPGFYSAKCMVLAAMQKHEQGLIAAQRGLCHARELAQGCPGRFESQIATLLLHAAEFYARLGRAEEAAEAQREAQHWLQASSGKS